MHFRSLFSLSCGLVIVISLCSMVSAKAAVTAQESQRQSHQHQLIVVKDIRHFARSNPGLTLVRMSKEPTRSRTASVRYTLGARVSYDQLVAQGTDSFLYPSKKDVTIQLTYPETGTGSVVTFVEVECIQDTSDGNAYVVAGGIGQRFISIVVEANNTERFTYTARFYGSD